MNLALFDLDHTLLPLDSDYEWGQFLARIGAVDPIAFAERNAEFYAQYQAGTLDPVAYLEFAFGTLARFPRRQLDAWHAQFMGKFRTQHFLQRFAKRYSLALACDASGCHQP